MANYQKNLKVASNKLSKYFGLYTARDLAGQVALSEIQRIPSSENTFGLLRPDPVVQDMIEYVVDTSEGAQFSYEVIQKLQNILNNSNVSQQQKDKILSFIEIYGTNDVSYTYGSFSGSLNENISFNNERINSSPNSPTKENPNLVVYKVNNTRISPTNKNINENVIFLNGVPSLELGKAVPILDIKLVVPQGPISDGGNLQNVSLNRFLEGNVNVTNSNTKRIMALATQQRQVENNQINSYTVAGMELFTAPQTLINPTDDNSTRINPILDKYVPLMTLKSFDVDIAPSTGIMSFKTAKLAFTLHDRSRLAEVADFIRPDLYSRTEILVEYGWSHPDASSTANISNYYGELINAMRCKEKYGIVNSSLTLGPSGQVEITLDLAMRGSIDFSTENISSDENGSVSRIIDRIRELEQAVGAYRARISGQSAGGSNREIRGIQILDAAEDARNHLIFDSNLKNNLNQFRQAMARGSNSSPLVNNILESLRNLYGSTQQGGDNNGQSSSGAVQQLQRSVQDQIRSKLERLILNTDSFLRIPNIPNRGSSGIRNTLDDYLQRAEQQQTSGRGSQAARNSIPTIELENNVPRVVSLAKLITLFIGEPLVNTGKYEEVQLLFYPFNQYAALANSMNIGSFAVDTRYFFEQYSRFRLENSSRAANMNIRDFLSFLSSTVIDDPAALSYGLFQAGLFRYERNDQGVLTSNAAFNAVELQSKMEQLLSGRTPDGSFRMPQVDFYIETCPHRVRDEDQDADLGDSQSILRIHIFDRQATNYEAQGSILAAMRDDEIRTISTIPFRADGDGGVVQSQEQEAHAIIQAAENANLIEPNPNSSGERQTFIIKGGTSNLKEFIMRTTPYIIFGAQGTTVKSCNVSSIQDAQLSTVNMLRSFQSTNMEPNGEMPGGIPMQIIPTEVSLECFGNPLIDFAQQFFIDFQTGTSIDNLYAVVGIQHQLAPGNFSTTLKLAPLDAWGRYRSLIERINSAQQELQRLSDIAETPSTSN